MILNIMNFRRTALSDYYRVTGSISWLGIIKQVLFGGGAYQYVFWMRCCRFTKEKNFLVRLVFHYPSKVMLRRATYKFGIFIPPEAEIGAGFYIGHFSGIFVNRECQIGRNCNISQGVTLGKSNRGKNKGSPVLGDNVYIGPGAKIVGGIRVGDNVAIGANCVVAKNIPDNAVVVGVPGEVISMDGSVGYINRIDYEQYL